jgi:glycine/D-amino acid oxidase-like deaminating enzyme
MLGEVQFTHVWSGKIGMTQDYMPRLHRIGPDAYAWAGCNGRAVALSVALGREFAAAIAGRDAETLALPLSEPKPLALHALAPLAFPFMLNLYRWRDAREI